MASIHAGPSAALAVGAVARRAPTRPGELLAASHGVVGPGLTGRRRRRRRTPPAPPSRSGRPRPSAAQPRPSANHGPEVWQRNARLPPSACGVTMLREPDRRDGSPLRPPRRSERRRRRVDAVGRASPRRRTPPTSPARSAATAGASVAGRPRQLGQPARPEAHGAGRRGRCRRPGARPTRVATGDVSTAASAHGSTPGAGRAVSAGTPGSQAPAASTTASTTRVWLATSTFGTSRSSAQRRIARAEPVEVDGRAVEPAPGERHRPLAPRRTSPGRSARS